MEPEKSAKFIKYLLFLQAFIAIGIGICEVIQLAEIDRSQVQVTQHPEDWNYLFGYTDNTFAIIIRIYYWLAILVTLAILGCALESFERRWKDIQNYSDNSTNITLLILWCIATIPSIILLSDADRLRTCSESSYSYKVPQRLLRHCNAYLASLFLAYIFIFTVIVQLLFNFVIIKHRREVSMKPPPNLQEPKKLKVRRSRRVNKKRSSLRSSAAFSVGTRLSIVTEDDEEKANTNRSSRSNRSVKSNKSNRSIKSDKNEFNSEMQVNSNA